MKLPARLPVAVIAAALLVVAACSGSAQPVAPTALTLYTSVTQDTVDAVTKAFATVHPEIHVDVYRAPTGQLDARIATEARSGGVRGDVLWATDPFSAASYAGQGMLESWTPAGAASLATADRSDSFWATRILNLVLVAHSGLSPQPRSWSDLANPAYRGKVAIPDPAFAGSAFAALGYFASEPTYGLDYYRRLKANGVVQVSAIGDVITGVAQGRYAVGISLDKSVRDAVATGSPIELIWPQPGAIALYSPIAVFRTSRPDAAARAFVEFLLSSAGQTAIGSTGWEPVDPSIAPKAGGPQVTADWVSLFGKQQDLLGQYKSILGGD